MTAKKSFWGNILWLFIFPVVVCLVLYGLRETTFSEYLKEPIKTKVFTEIIEFNPEVEIYEVFDHKTAKNYNEFQEIIKNKIQTPDPEGTAVTFAKKFEKLNPSEGYDYTNKTKLPINICENRKSGIKFVYQPITKSLKGDSRRIEWYAYVCENKDGLSVYYEAQKKLTYRIINMISIFVLFIALAPLLFGVIKAVREP